VTGLKKLTGLKNLGVNHQVKVQEHRNGPEIPGVNKGVYHPFLFFYFFVTTCDPDLSSGSPFRLLFKGPISSPQKKSFFVFRACVFPAHSPSLRCPQRVLCFVSRVEAGVTLSPQVSLKKAEWRALFLPPQLLEWVFFGRARKSLTMADNFLHSEPVSVEIQQHLQSDVKHQ
jgi:hypothetical protein